MLLKVENLCCGYKKEVIVENVSFNLSEGEILFLFGPNGVGKTTFFKTLLGLLKAIDGKIIFGDQRMEDMSRQSLAKKMAYVPQAHQMAFAFNVIDVVVMGRIAHMGKNARPENHDYQKAWEALEILKISHLGERHYTQISGGERQMVLIARALTQDAPILIMDEPTSNLDFGNQMKVMEHIGRLRDDNYAIVITTHSPDQVLHYGDQVMVFHKGNLTKIGNPQEIMTSQLLKDIYDVDVKISTGKKQLLSSICVPC
ncbi:ABC transporter ATP-binding protein [Acetobacterium bakii]|uniref:ABC transporter domain-containing protein n=1 Tax=Acetobacterium bakii TaxID=52689 RepID=A0A0L6TVT8_9FIRM|nr:ABC transporter ATP-binding protein [Acetobacterium bakii]KNZ40369.1 hypothetical protein AKG39_17980 [Acetobacterium bakii]